MTTRRAKKILYLFDLTKSETFLALNLLTPFDYLKAKQFLGAKTAQKQHHHRPTIQIPHRVCNLISKHIVKNFIRLAVRKIFIPSFFLGFSPKYLKKFIV